MARHPNQKSPFESVPRHMKKPPEERPETVRARDLKSLEALQKARPEKPPGRRQ